MRLLRFALALAVATAGFADTITLRSGRVITGTYLGGTARQVMRASADQGDSHYRRQQGGDGERILQRVPMFIPGVMLVVFAPGFGGAVCIAAAGLGHDVMFGSVSMFWLMIVCASPDRLPETLREIIAKFPPGDYHSFSSLRYLRNPFALLSGASLLIRSAGIPD